MSTEIDIASEEIFLSEDFLENEIVGFDENLTVVSWCDVQQMSGVAIKLEAIVCDRHQETLTWPQLKSFRLWENKYKVIRFSPLPTGI